MATPTARSLLNAYQGDSPDDLNQLLGTHKLSVIYDNATPVVAPAQMLFAGNMPLYAPRGRDAHLVSSTMTYNNLIKSDNPLGFWRLNETSGTVAHDEMGLHDGTYQYDPAAGGYGGVYDPVAGVKDTMAGLMVAYPSYGWPNQYVQVTGGWRPVIYTQEIWMLIPAGAPSPSSYTMSSHNDNYGAAGAHMAFSGGGTPAGYIPSGQIYNGGWDSAISGVGTLGQVSVAAGWHHFVVTADGVAHPKLYMDGVLLVPQYSDYSGGVLTPAAGNCDFTIGQFGIGGTYPRPAWGCALQECAIYDYGLTAMQVLAHYNAAANIVNVIEETSASLDQPITLSGDIDRITLPLSTYKGVGTDMLISLYADSAGAPSGLPLASTLVPKESLVVATPMTESAPAPIEFNGPSMMDAMQVILPPPSAGGIGFGLGPLFHVAMVSAYDYIIAMGGQDGWTNAITNAVSIAPALATDAGPALGTWVPTIAMPVALTECGAAVFPGDAGSFVVLVGGTPDFVTGVVSTWTASIDETGTLGSWMSQPDLPTTIRGARVMVSNGFVYILGGARADGSNTVYCGAIDTSGTIAPWVESATPFDPTYAWGMAGGATNGYLLAGGGIDVTGSTVIANWWIAHPLPDGTVPGWIPLPNAPVATGDGASAVMGDTLVCTGGSYGSTFTITVSPDGDISRWTMQSPLQGMNGSSAVTTDSTFWVFAGYYGAFQTTLTRVPFISVPLQATSLASAPYHFVISLAGPADNNNDSQVTTSVVSPGATYGQGLAKLDVGAFASETASVLPTDMGGASILEGWTHSGVRGVSVVSDVAYTGGALVLTDDYQVIVNTATSTDLITNQDNVDITGPLAIPVSPGQNYTFSADFIATTAARIVHIMLWWADLDGHVINPTADAVGTGTDNSSTPTTVSLQAAAPSWARFAKLQIEITNTGYIHPTGTHTVTNITLNPTYGYVPISVYSSGLTAQPIHIVEDTIDGQPHRHGWLSYKYSGQLLRYVESTLESINLLSRNASSFGTSIKGDTSGWGNLTNCTVSIVPLSHPPLGPGGPSGELLFPAYDVQQMEWGMQLSSNAAGTQYLDAGRGTSGVPVIAGMSYTAFAFLQATTTPRSILCSIVWYDETGTINLGTSYGGGDVDTTTTWTQTFVTDIAPAGAAFASMFLYVYAAAAAAELHTVACASLAVTSYFPLTYFTPGQRGIGNVRTLNYALDGSLASVT